MDRTTQQAEKKTILVVVDWFYPGYKAGGPIQSTLNLAFALKHLFRIKVLSTDTDLGETDPYQDITTEEWINNLDDEFSCFYLQKSTLTLNRLKKRIVEENADIVYLNHMFSPKFVIYPIWLKYTGKLKSKLVVSPRGALYDSALAVKPWKKYPFLWLLKQLNIQKMVTFHATNEREKKAIEKFFPQAEIVIADNLPKSNQPEFISLEKKPGAVSLIFIARIVPIKNLLFLLEVLKDAEGDITLTIVGPLEDQAYWEQCREKIAGFDSHIKVDVLGPKNNDLLTGLIRQHHLFVLPTEGENFGHSIFEAILSGRPVLISDQTPWHNLQDKMMGWDLPLADKSAFLRSLEEAVSWNQEEFDQHAKSAWQFGSAFIKDQKRIKAYQMLFS